MSVGRCPRRASPRRSGPNRGAADDQRVHPARPLHGRTAPVSQTGRGALARPCRMCGTPSGDNSMSCNHPGPRSVRSSVEPLTDSAQGQATERLGSVRRSPGQGRYQAGRHIAPSHLIIICISVARTMPRGHAWPLTWPRSPEIESAIPLRFARSLLTEARRPGRSRRAGRSPFPQRAIRSAAIVPPTRAHSQPRCRDRT